MPYKLRKVPKKDLYWVVSTETGQKHSKEGLPRERAEAQMRALYANMGAETSRGKGNIFPKSRLRGGMDEPPPPPPLPQLHRAGTAENPQFMGDEIWIQNPPPPPPTPEPEQEILFRQAQRRTRCPPTTRPKRGSGWFTNPFSTAMDSVSKSLSSRWEQAKQNTQAGKIGSLGKIGGGPIPSKDFLQQVSTQAYEQNPARAVGDLQLLQSTPTLKFYKAPDNTIVVGIRGTVPTDSRDVKADAMIAIGQLESSDRFLSDLDTLRQFQIRYSPSQYDYYGVGHSLGGAILDSFLSKGLLKNGVSYNPAVQPQNFSNTSLPNQRIYAENDPLYAVMGRNLSAKPEVRKQRKKSWWEKAISFVPYAGKAYDLYTGHQLDQFRGGGERSWKQFLIEAHYYLSPAIFNFLARRAIDDPNTDFDDLVHMIATQAQPFDANQRALAWLKTEGKTLWDYLRRQMRGGTKHKFHAQLRKEGIQPSVYLKEAQRRAKKAGLPYRVLGFSDDGIHKLAIPDANGKMIRFGRVGYGDHLIWSHLESEGNAPKGTAAKKRHQFQSSHQKIRGNWKANPFSPNNLALNVLW